MKELSPVWINFKPLDGLANLVSFVPEEIEAVRAIEDVRSLSKTGDNGGEGRKKFRQVVFAWFSLRVAEGLPPNEIKRLAQKYIDLASGGSVEQVFPAPVKRADRRTEEQSPKYQLIKAIKDLIF
ncbi:MAG: hypothetical protein Q8P89_01275 [bacterium]|nr:hypothetical protein [bacterium]